MSALLRRLEKLEEAARTVRSRGHPLGVLVPPGTPYTGGLENLSLLAIHRSLDEKKRKLREEEAYAHADDTALSAELCRRLSDARRS